MARKVSKFYVSIKSGLQWVLREVPKKIFSRHSAPYLKFPFCGNFCAMWQHWQKNFHIKDLYCSYCIVTWQSISYQERSYRKMSVIGAQIGWGAVILPTILLPLSVSLQHEYCTSNAIPMKILIPLHIYFISCVASIVMVLRKMASRSDKRT